MKVNDFKKDGYFKLDCETHLYPDISHLSYFKWLKKGNIGAAGVARAMGLTQPEVAKLAPPPTEWPPSSPPEALIDLMDKYGIDMACIMREDVTIASGFSAPYSTNGQILEYYDRYPERFIFVANVSPMLRRGMDESLWELEYLVQERNCKIVKIIGEHAQLDDRRFWPFYEKVCDLGITLFMHTGCSWVPPTLSKYYHPKALDEIAIQQQEIFDEAYPDGPPGGAAMTTTGAAPAGDRPRRCQAGSDCTTSDSSRYSRRSVYRQPHHR